MFWILNFFKNLREMVWVLSVFIVQPQLFWHNNKDYGASNSNLNFWTYCDTYYNMLILVKLIKYELRYKKKYAQNTFFRANLRTIIPIPTCKMKIFSVHCTKSPQILVCRIPWVPCKCLPIGIKHLKVFLSNI